MNEKNKKKLKKNKCLNFKWNLTRKGKFSKMNTINK